MARVIQNNPQAILVYESESAIAGTISIIDDGRVAMLYRFVVPPDAFSMARELYSAAVATLKQRGHTEILVYSAPNDPMLDERYMRLGITKGGDYSCFWAGI